MTEKQGVSRRQLAAIIGSAAAVRAQVSAQDAPPDDLTQARERLRRASAELRKIKLEPSVEPAFRFRA